MTQDYRWPNSHKSLGDIAVDGLFNGMLAGIVSGVVVFLGGLAMGETPFQVFGHFDTPQRMSVLVGALVYLGVSGLFGVVFNIVRGVWTRLRALGWWSGLAYGVGLFFFDVFLVGRGTESTLSAIPLWVLVASHLVYGAALGWLIERGDS